MQFGILGGGSWATAIAKILTDNGNTINWWIRSETSIQYLQKRRHNPHYLGAAYFEPTMLNLSSDLAKVVAESEILVVAVPSAFIAEVLSVLPKNALEGKQIISAIKGILPASNQLLNHYLTDTFSYGKENYHTLLGPCHAEEVAAEKLSYLTFSGIDTAKTIHLANHFKTEYINVLINNDVIGVQYAAIMKNIYALGAGIAHGLEYGDNFLSVYIANAAKELSTFLQQISFANGHCNGTPPKDYSASVYLGDLLVTCYSLYSRNRTFGNMIGKGYSVKAAQLELNMVAEGYNASRCIYVSNQTLGADIPIATAIYQILWEQLLPKDGFREIEAMLV